MSRLPALFVSHGAPLVAIDNSAAHRFFSQYGKELPRPRAIVVFSAHWESDEVRITASPAPRTIHDFGRFDDRLFELRYPSPGDPALAAQIKDLLDKAGIGATLDPLRGLDHGAWIPLLLMYPQADIPVLQVSINPLAGPGWHLKLGEALKPLRGEGVLLIGSGSLTHNLHEFRGQRADTPALPWVVDFAEWVEKAMAEGRRDDLLAYREKSATGVKNHPTEEHFLPLFVGIGAADAPLKATRVHHSYDYGILAMDAFAFA